MDFHSLTRRELQSLCKLNKIPANITNVAMADALGSLQTVVGIEDFFKESQPEPVDPVKPVEEKVAVEVVPSPKAPQTRCRTSTRQQKAKTADPSTVIRTTRRGSKQPPAEVQEPKNDMLKTPAVSRTTRKAAGTASCRNASSQMDCENEAKQEGLVENKYSTRRSTRQTERTERMKSAAVTVKKGSVKAVKIDSFVETGNSNGEVEEICDAFEKLDVIAAQKSEKEDEECDEVKDLEDDLKISEMKTDEVEDCGEIDNLKQESDETINSCEDMDFEDDLKISEMKTDQVYDAKPETDGTCEEEEDCEDETLDSCDNDLNISEVKNDDVYDPKPDSENKIPVSCEEENIVSDDTSSPLDDESLGQKEEIFDTFSGGNVSAVKENSLGMVQESSMEELESGADVDEEMNFQVPESNESSTVASLIIEDTKNPIEAKEEMSENISIVDEVCDEVSNLKHETLNSCDNDDVYDPKPDSENKIPISCEDENLVSGDNFMSALKEEENHVMVQVEHSGLDGESLGQKADFGEEEIFDTISVKENSFGMVQESSSIEELESVSAGANADEEMNFQVPESNVNFCPIEASEGMSENVANEKSDADPLMLSEVKKATPFKNALSVVSDNKENIVYEGKHRKKEMDEMEKQKNYNDMSIRQLKKQLRALSLNSKGDAASETPRPALQPLCENQMVVGGDTKN